MSYSVAIKSSLLVSLVAILISFYFNNVSDFIGSGLNVSRQSSILNGLLELEQNNFVLTGAEKPRVAVGYGACHDIFVNAKDLLKDDKLKGPPKHFDEIRSNEQFFKSFAYYFKHGAAAERFMPDSELFKQWVTKAASLPDARWALGGNAPVMASRFYKEGCKVLLAAKMTEELKKSIPADIQITDGEGVKEDDVHLILEYKTDDKWSSIKTPRANRYIMHNDRNNPTVSSLEYFGEVLPKFKPDLLVVSGLQMMDNYPFSEGVREQRLEAIKKQMISQDEKTRVHFEMASFVEEKLLKDLTKKVIPYSDSIGMNEQELTNLHNIYKSGGVTHASDFNPRVAQVLDDMRDLYKMIRSSSRNIKNAKKLTRIHVHTLAFQMILVEKDSKWQRPKAAAAKASLIANRHACGKTNIDVQKARLIMDESFSLSMKPGSKRMNMADENPVTCWDETITITENETSDVHICVAPVLVCTDVKQTAGCGDNISSAGLVLQI